MYEFGDLSCMHSPQPAEWNPHPPLAEKRIGRVATASKMPAIRTAIATVPRDRRLVARNTLIDIVNPPPLNGASHDGYRGATARVAA
jgi:hypothetical protein